MDFYELLPKIYKNRNDFITCMESSAALLSKFYPKTFPSNKIVEISYTRPINRVSALYCTLERYVFFSSPASWDPQQQTVKCYCNLLQILTIWSRTNEQIIKHISMIFLNMNYEVSNYHSTLDFIAETAIFCNHLNFIRWKFYATADHLRLG